MCTYTLTHAHKHACTHKQACMCACTHSQTCTHTVMTHCFLEVRNIACNEQKKITMSDMAVYRFAEKCIMCVLRKSPKAVLEQISKFLQILLT